MRPAIVDVHSHVLDRAFLEMLADTPNPMLAVARDGNGYRVPGYGPLDTLLYDLDGRLESLGRRGIAEQLVAPPPPLWSKASWAAGVEEARLMNAATRRCVAASSGRLSGLAVLALAQPAEAVAELRRELDAGGFVGAALPTTVAGRALDNAEFEPLLEYLAETETFAFMHAVTAEVRASLADFSLNTVIGWPCETAVAVARLIFSGMLERHPLRLVLSHGGGVLPMLAGRLDLAYSAPKYEANPACRRQIGRPPSTYLKALYYDTVVASADSLDFVLRFAGTRHVLFGSDFPYEIGDAEGALAWPALERLDGDDRALVLAGNAERLLRRTSDA